MKKLLGITIAMMLGISMIGCESTEENNAKVEKPEVKQEEQVEVEESETEKEKVVPEFDKKELKHYLTTNLSEEEYDKYFNSIKDDENGYYGRRVIEFDGCILDAQLREGYDTRFEMLMVAGDYSEDEINGPYIKVKDIAGTELGNLVFGKCNVKVKATIDKYDSEQGYLMIDILEIEAR